MSSDIDTEKNGENDAGNTSAASLDYNQLLKLALDIGEQIMLSGGEVSRVEETVSRICMAYGAVRADVFSITSALMVTVDWGEKGIFTQSRRMMASGRNFSKLEKLNNLSRYICAERPDLNVIKSRVDEIMTTKRQSFVTAMVGSFLAAGGFAVFFGGTLMDAVAAMLCALLIFLVDRYIYNNHINRVVYYIIASFMAGSLAILMVTLGIGNNLDMIMIGCIMLVIPGINFTSAVEDVLAGDTVTGTLKLYESVLIACAIACGFAFAVYICGGSTIL